MITMNDIAAKAGVSQSTVSLVLNNRQRRNGTISDATRQRILQVAEEMGYRRNELARAMVTGKNRVIGFMTNNPAAEIQSRLMVGSHEEANERGYSIKLLHLSPKTSFEAALRRSVEQRLSGVLAVNLSQDELHMLRSESARYRLQVAMLDDIRDQGWAIRVTSDDKKGIAETVDFLVQIGHSRIAFMSPPPDSFLKQPRCDGFLEAMQRHGLDIPSHYIVEGNWWDPGCNEPLIYELLKQTSPPTALICSADSMAMSALRVARALGLEVPADLSITGYGNSAWAYLTDPPLSSVEQPFEDIGRTATHHMLNRIEADDWNNEPLEVILPTKIFMRSSTSPLGGW